VTCCNPSAGFGLESPLYGVSAAILEAEKKFRRVQGWRDIEKLVRALEAHEQNQETEAKRVA